MTLHSVAPWECGLVCGAVSQQRQKDLYADTDGRLRKLEAGNSSATNTATEIKEPQAQFNSTNTTPAESTAESKAFEGAQALLQAGKYKDAFDAFDKFLQGYANSKQVPNAQYGLGYAQFSLKNYKAAIATQQKLMSQFPDSLKVPDAKFNIANCQIQLSDIEGAKKSLRDLIAQHPTSELVPNAKRRLAVLESIKK
jgi:tol-pal system protein YbgF